MAAVCFYLASLIIAIFPGVVTKSRPLLLSPYLANGDLSGAREASAVHYPLIPPSHSGYLTVNTSLGNHLFFWLIPCETNPEAPLLMWLNGGPGTSSMMGAFSLHGPLEVHPEFLQFVPRNLSWTKHFSMLYVDSPVGTGFSFSDQGLDGLRTTLDDVTDDLFSFVEQFFGLFPEYNNTEFYIGGQSYGGKYVPELAHRIHAELLVGNIQIPLQGIYLGNPFFDPRVMGSVYFQLPYVLGALTETDFENANNDVEQFLHEVGENGIGNYSVFQLFMNLSPFTNLNMYNFHGSERQVEIYKQIGAMMMKPDIQRVFHTVNALEFSGFNITIATYLKNDFLTASTPKLAVLMDNYKVLIYTGNYDVITGTHMVDHALRKTDWSLKHAYNNASRTVWYRQDQSKVRTAFYSLTGQFCRVVVHAAGHYVPIDQPETMLAVIKDFIEHGCLTS